MKPIKAIYLVDEWLPFGGGEIFMQDLITHMPQQVEFLATVCAGPIARIPANYPVPLMNVDEFSGSPDVILFSGRTGPVMDRFSSVPIRIMLAHSDFNVDWYMKPASEYATHMIAVSRKVKEATKFHPCKVIWPGIDFKSYKATGDMRALLGFTDEDYVVGQFGRITKFKRLEMIVDAISDLDDKVKFLIVGNGNHTAQILKYCNERIPERFVYLSYVDVRHIGSLYEAIDVFCHASEGEGCPRVLWESLYYGKPFIGTPVGSIPDIVEPGVTGYVVNDSKQMEQAIQAARSGILSSESMKLMARRQGTIESTVSQYVKHLQSLVGSRTLL